ncbi:MAG: hypothetical protein IGS03_01685 [Candidatus Sericytochromatia bacterium]|nr:hypothetical protein [Candidatus Sericytochromatia bacterium]
MIDLSKLTEMVNTTNALAQAQQQVNASQQQAQSAQQSGGQPSAEPTGAAGQLFAQLGSVLNAASSAPPQSNAEMVDLQQAAALVSSKVSALVAQANALEDQINLAPTPDAVSVDELFAEFSKILAQLTEDMNALQKKVQEKKQESEMSLEQKPTALKAGESATDLSFNRTLS